MSAFRKVRFLGAGLESRSAPCVGCGTHILPDSAAWIRAGETNPTTEDFWCSEECATGVLCDSGCTAPAIRRESGVFLCDQCWARMGETTAVTIRASEEPPPEMPPGKVEVLEPPNEPTNAPKADDHPATDATEIW